MVRKASTISVTEGSNKEPNKGAIKKEAQRERIFQAALVCFSRQGVRRTNMSDVAREAKVSRPAIYYYFKDKQSLVVEVVLRLQTEAYDVSGRDLKAPVYGLEAIIEAATLGVEHSLKNPYLKTITLLESERLTAAVLNSEMALKARNEYWGELLGDARQRGELREDIDDEEIIRWLVFLQFQMVVNGHLIESQDYASIRRTFELFVLPALKKA